MPRLLHNHNRALILYYTSSLLSCFSFFYFSIDHYFGPAGLPFSLPPVSTKPDHFKNYQCNGFCINLHLYQITALIVNTYGQDQVQITITFWGLTMQDPENRKIQFLPSEFKTLIHQHILYIEGNFHIFSIFIRGYCLIYSPILPEMRHMWLFP